MRVITYTQEGKVTGITSAVGDALDIVVAKAVENGLGVLELTEDVDWKNVYVEPSSKQVVPIPPQPSPAHRFSYETKQWEERPEQAKAETQRALREARNVLLRQSDWTQLPDTRLTGPERAEWVQYRNELRDLPQVYAWATSLEDVEWPVEPV